MKWELYVDESGRFERPEETVVVAGLLVTAGTRGFAPARLRDALQRAVPDVPWPIHAWLTRRPVAHLLWRVKAARADLSDLPAPARAAATHLDAKLGPAWRRAVRVVRAGLEPADADLDALDKELASVAALGRHWYQVARRVGAAIHGVAAAAVDEQADAQAVLVLAGETRDGAAADEVDRYLAVLACLCERAAEVVGTWAGAHEVHLNVLGRHVREPALARKVPLTPQRVGAAAARYLGDERVYAYADATVRLVPWEVATWGADVAPPLVIADWLANRSRGQCRQNTPLAELLDRLEKVTGVAPRAGGQPALTAFGLAREYVADARHGVVVAAHPLRSARGVRSWVREQAERWGAYYA